MFFIRKANNWAANLLLLLLVVTHHSPNSDKLPFDRMTSFFIIGRPVCDTLQLSMYDANNHYLIMSLESDFI